MTSAEKTILISIKPKYANAILDGHKNIELRKNFPFMFKGKMYIYASIPIKKIIGEVEVKEVHRMKIPDLWKYSKSKFKSAFITKEEFDDYFLGKEYGFALHIENPARYKTQIYLKEINLTRPPQSFMYLHGEQLLTNSQYQDVVSSMPERLPW